MSDDDEKWRCHHSRTRPDPAEFTRGYYNDGGFHHCHCGAIVEWENGVVGDHRDQFLMAAITRLRGEPRAKVEEWLWPGTQS